MVKVKNKTFAASDEGQRTSNSVNLMRDLAASFGVNEAQVKIAFSGGRKLRMPTKTTPSSFVKRVKADKKILGQEKGLGKVKMELLTKLYNTKPFFDDAIEDFVMRPSQLDYIFAFLVDAADFRVNYSKTAKSSPGYSKSEITNLLGSDQYSDNDNRFHLKTVYCNASLRNRSTGEELIEEDDR